MLFVLLWFCITMGYILVSLTVRVNIKLINLLQIFHMIDTDRDGVMHRDEVLSTPDEVNSFVVVFFY